MACAPGLSPRVARAARPASKAASSPPSSPWRRSPARRPAAQTPPASGPPARCCCRSAPQRTQVRHAHLCTFRSLTHADKGLDPRHVLSGGLECAPQLAGVEPLAKVNILATSVLATSAEVQQQQDVQVAIRRTGTAEGQQVDTTSVTVCSNRYSMHVMLVPWPLTLVWRRCET